MRRLLSGRLAKMAVAATLLLGGMAVGAPAAHADGTCSVSGSISQLPPTLTNPNPVVTFTGHAVCSTVHWLALTTHLTLDCGFNCTDVATGGPAAVTSTRSDGWDTYSPNVCLPAPTSINGTPHTWYMEAYLYAGDVNDTGYHTTAAYYTLPFRCPGVLG